MSSKYVTLPENVTDPSSRLTVAHNVVAVENSGNADASGLIEIRYSGNSLSAISATDLVLDGQGVTLRF